MPEPIQNQPKAKAECQPIRLTVRLSPEAYDAIIDLQRIHRGKTGRALPTWKIIEAAILAYAKNNHITTTS